MEKKDWINLIIIILTVIIIMFVTKGIFNIYGSKTDWMSQHWVLPEYFRALFYETKNIFPNFAPNIGGGQNIYNFSYYGFLNPVILISYFLPFIKMIDYIMISSVLIVILSIVLFYKWLKSHNLCSNNVFIATFSFALANSLIFHSHRHIMFINYMPFLILALMGIDKYFKDGKRWLFIISTFLIIMTSYFYSVSCLLVLGMYCCYKLIKNKCTMPVLFSHLLKLLSAVIISILMASVLLLPTIYVIKNGRGIDTHAINLFSLLKPNFNFNSLLYNSYSPGFTAIALVSLISSIFSKEKSIKFLAIFISCLFFTPFFAYVLNGMLYIRYKVFIPFLPLIGLLISNFWDSLKDKKLPLIKIILFLLLIIIFNRKDQLITVFIIDLIITLMLIFLYKLKNLNKIIYIPILLIIVLNSVYGNSTENFVSKKQYFDEFNTKDEFLIKDIIKNDDSVYRFTNLNSALSTSNKVYDIRHYQTTLYSSTYNTDYNYFYYDVFKNAIPYRNRVITAASPNVFFQLFMGVKYIGTNNAPPIGYVLVEKNENNFSIYKNKSAFPLVYVTNNIVSVDDFKQLNYPYTIEPLLKGVVVDNATNYKYNTTIKEIDLKYTSNINENIEIIQNNNIYEVIAKKNNTISLGLDNPENKVIIVTFKMNFNQGCKDGDVGIVINGIKNVLTCKEWIYHNENFEFEYIISNERPIEKLKIDFQKGKYIISDLKIYTVDYDDLINNSEKSNKINVDIKKTKGDKIYGKINVDEDGYLVTSIPFDKGFKIKINGVLQQSELVNMAFLGAKIDKGINEVEIVYESPLYKQGVVSTVFGSICFLIILFVERNEEVNYESRNSN